MDGMEYKDKGKKMDWPMEKRMDGTKDGNERTDGKKDEILEFILSLYIRL